MYQHMFILIPPKLYYSRKYFSIGNKSLTNL